MSREILLSVCRDGKNRTRRVKDNDKTALDANKCHVSQSHYSPLCQAEYYAVPVSAAKGSTGKSLLALINSDSRGHKLKCFCFVVLLLLLFLYGRSKDLTKAQTLPTFM